MKINIIKDIEKESIIWKGINNYYGITNQLGSIKLGYLIGKYENLNGINSIIYGIKNVTGSEKDFWDIANKEPFDLTDGSPEPLENWYKAGKTRIWDWYINDPEDFIIPMPEEYKGKIPYKWSCEVAFAESFSDITIVTDSFSYDEKQQKYTKIEYYSTPEVLEVLEKWKKALEKWNNPEERQKMIEEYERNNQGKT